ncbi:13910_t:CDS:1, partial [Cetraspora pellucida]
MHQLGLDFVVSLKSFNEKYGGLYEIYMGSTRLVIISRPDLAEKVWKPSTPKNTTFIMRHTYSEGIDELDIGTKGTALNRNIEVWAINRKNFLSVITSPPFLREVINLSSKMTDQMFDYWKSTEEQGMQVEVF